MSAETETVVTNFCKAWSRLDANEVMSFFTDDALYHNIPMKPAHGKEAILKVVNSLLKGTTLLEFKILHTASNGNVVFNERVDTAETNGKRASLPVVGVFEVTPAGKISAWRDYFDLEMFMKQIR